MTAFDDEQKQRAKDHGLVLFRFEIERKFTDRSDGKIRNHQCTMIITPEMDKEFNEMLKRWEKVKRG